jgi:16S rRNA U516 pseudouridylate synthase RsuA-like enzyme
VLETGWKRQVRRMCEAIGHPVTRLVRTRIGPISDKTAAAKLCSQLKSQGMPDCLVTSQ